MMPARTVKYLCALILATLSQVVSLHAVTTVLFDGDQTIQLTSEGTIWDHMHKAFNRHRRAHHHRRSML
jgi:hypothetical protein